MARTLLQLADDLEKRAKQLRKAASDKAAFIALSLVEELADITPVDTSKAISNWRVGLGSPVTGELEPHYPGFKGSTELMSEDATVIAARIALKQKRPGQTIFVSNTAPYIVDLDGGSSLQEPRGFVKRATDRARELAKRTKFEVK